ncbi:MAG TPA: glycoside hydrolase family 3 protein [Candidatus Parcubacteria bacterium]|nr:glycoside hydrolase family 3 protein [Candidatus Parcubacteria bacterium]
MALQKKKLIYLFIFFLSGLFILFAFYSKDYSRNEQEDDFVVEKENTFEKTSLSEMLGQIFVIGFVGKEITPDVRSLFETIKPGGIIIFSRNIENESQLKNLISQFQKLSVKLTGLPLFVVVDQEGEPIRRIRWIDDGISQSEIKNENQAYWFGFYRGKKLKEMGINVNLAPVLDIAEKGDFIYSRCFQKDPLTNGKLAGEIINGQKDAGILTAIKHFPGYGGIKFNPEKVEIPILPSTPEIKQFELAIKSKPEFVMAGNVIYKSIDKEKIFSLSKKGTNFLRQKIKGDYLIMSDDLSSDVLEKKFPESQQVAMAIKAGINVIIIAGGKESHKRQLNAFYALKRAVKDKEIEKQVQNSIYKIIKLKKESLSGGIIGY